MNIVDDQLSLLALAGRLDLAPPVATTWGFHCRLLRALQDDIRWGVLSQATTDQVRQVVADPPEDRLRILDPRTFTEGAARVARRHQVNLLAAELVAAAVYHRAAVYLASGNVGHIWPAVLAAEEVQLTIV